jgi:hypothetical protein
VIALLLVGVPGNIGLLSDYSEPSPFLEARRAFVLTAPRVPIAKELPRSVPLATFLPLGWMLDSLPSGRIPQPPPRTPTQIANVSLQLALPPTDDATGAACATLDAPIERVLARGDRLTVREGRATITYVPATGAPSTPRAFPPSTVVSVVDNLPVRIAPAGGEPTTLCG